MIRFAVRPLVLAFCLSMAVGVSLLATPETGEATGPTRTEQQEDRVESSSKKGGNMSSLFLGDEKDDDKRKNKGANAQSSDGAREGREDKTKNDDIKDSEEEPLSNQDDSVEQDISDMKEDIASMKQKMEGYIQTLLVAGAILGILLLFCLIGLGYLLFFKEQPKKKASPTNDLSEGLEDIKDEMDELKKKIEAVEKKQSSGNASYTNQSKTSTGDVGTRLAALENAVSNLQEKLSSLQSAANTMSTDNRFATAKQEPVEEKQSISVNRGSFSESQQSFGGSSRAQGRLKEIVDDFNKMRKDAKSAAGYGGADIRRNFTQKYQVVTFTCVNFEERVKDTKLPPRFARVDSLPDSTLWGVPLSEGMWAVLPSISTYTSNLHGYGGMKELFDSHYESGSYSNIVVDKPAIMTSNFSEIREKGVLSFP